MATNTYVALDTKVLASPAASVTFSSIPSGYTDLRLVMQGRTDTGNNVDYAVVRLNNDATSLYSRTEVYGDGSSAGSGRAANFLIGISSTAQGGNTDIKTMSTMDFMNYSNTTTFKSVLYRQASAAQITLSGVGLYRSTSAISTITLTPFYGTWQAGSTFTIYGIASQPAPTAKATGGTITYDVSYTYHTFTSSGTFTPLESLNVDYLAIAGGGGGGYSFGGGGGAGGFLTANNYAVTATGYGITVGAGGAGGTSGAGTSGGNSVFGSFVSVGGGGGGSDMGDPDNGANGGSGGGSAIDPSTTATGTAGQGNNGGLGNRNNSRLGGGGGGGAGAVGGNNNGAGTAGAGGNGLATTFTGTSVTYAGGGGAGGSSSYSTVGGAAGTGGAGAGGVGGGAGGNASGNTGSGGGGGQQGNNGGNGGSGIVIIRYAN